MSLALYVLGTMSCGQGLHSEKLVTNNISHYTCLCEIRRVSRGIMLWCGVLLTAWLMLRIKC